MKLSEILRVNKLVGNKNFYFDFINTIASKECFMEDKDTIIENMELEIKIIMQNFCKLFILQVSCCVNDVKYLEDNKYNEIIQKSGIWYKYVYMQIFNNSYDFVDSFKILTTFKVDYTSWTNFFIKVYAVMSIEKKLSHSNFISTIQEVYNNLLDKILLYGIISGIKTESEFEFMGYCFKNIENNKLIPFYDKKIRGGIYIKDCSINELGNSSSCTGENIIRKKIIEVMKCFTISIMFLKNKLNNIPQFQFVSINNTAFNCLSKMRSFDIENSILSKDELIQIKTYSEKINMLNDVIKSELISITKNNFTCSRENFFSILIIWESLFADSQNISFKVAYCISKVLKKIYPEENLLKTFQKIKTIYGLRSKIIHGENTFNEMLVSVKNKDFSLINYEHLIINFNELFNLTINIINFLFEIPKEYLIFKNDNIPNWNNIIFFSDFFNG